MSYRLRAQEFAAVSRLPGPKRYEHFVQRVADWGEVWGLFAGEGWVTLADDQGHPCLPFWPHADYARALATGEWQGAEPRQISFADFLGKWLPGMARDGAMVAVFPTQAGQGVVVPPDRLRQELARISGDADE